MKTKTNIAHVREYKTPLYGKYRFNVQICQMVNDGKDITYATYGKLCESRESVRDFLRSAEKHYTEIVHLNV